MTLIEAAAVFFPHGPLTLSSLRRAAAAGTLEIAKVAGKDLTTPRAIRKLVKPSCRAAKPSRHDSGSEKTNDAGSSSIDQRESAGRSAQVAAATKLTALRKRSKPTSAARHTTTIGATDPSVLAIADVLTAYEISKRPKDKNDERAWAQHDLLLIRLLDLNGFFGDKTVSELKAQLCRDFVDWSTGTPNENNRKAGITAAQGTVSDQTARRRLEDLRAAVNAYHAEHTLSVVPKITLPPKAEGRHRWLTRNEAARLLGAAIGYVWDNERSSWKRKEDGKLLRRERWIIRRRYPAARFCLIGVYSARREETIRRTQWLPTTTHPWMNLDAMVYQGKGALERSTKKRRPPAKIASRLRPHLVRWCKTRPNALGRAARGRHSSRTASKSGSSSTASRRSAACRQDQVGLGRHSAGCGAWRGCRPALAAPHSGDLADAGRRRHVGGCWLARNDRRAAGGELRPPPSRIPGRGR